MISLTFSFLNFKIYYFRPQTLTFTITFVSEVKYSDRYESKNLHERFVNMRTEIVNCFNGILGMMGWRRRLVSL